VVENRKRVLRADSRSDDSHSHHQEDANVRMQNKPWATGADIEGLALLKKEVNAKGRPERPSCPETKEEDGPDVLGDVHPVCHFFSWPVMVY
jgi:hypothetical protein